MRRFWNAPLTGLNAAAAIVLCIIVITLIFSASNSVINSSNRVEPSKIYFATAEKIALPQRFEAQGEPKKLHSQFLPRQKDSRRFHITFEGERLDEIPHTLWVPHSGANTIVYINNAKSGESEARQYSLLGTGQESLIYDIPRMQLLPGRNRIDIYVGEDTSRSGLGPVYFGPTESIRKQVIQSKLVSNIVPTIAYVTALFALILNLIATLTPKGLAKYLSLGLAAFSLVILYKFNLSWPLLTLALGIAIYTLAEIKNGGLHYSQIVLISVALTGVSSVCLRSLGPLPFPDPTVVSISLWVGALPLLIIPAFKALLNVLDERRSRVDELEEALDDTQNTLEKEIRKRAIFEERERLTRDIHDGVGGQLLGLLLRLRTGDVPRESITRDLQSGLNDLRLVVDALDHTGNDLEQALRAFRDRAENQLDAAGISLKWTQVEDFAVELQGQDAVLNLYRILQEALNNIIRHADANEVEINISIHKQDRILQIDISDNGVGRGKTAKPGRGTLNMQRRADVLGGSISTSSGLRGSGHSVSVSLPLSGALRLDRNPAQL